MESMNGFSEGAKAYAARQDGMIGGPQPGTPAKGPSLASAAESADYLAKMLSEVMTRLNRLGTMLGGPEPTQGEEAKAQPRGVGVFALADTIQRCQGLAQQIHNETTRLERLVGVG